MHVDELVRDEWLWRYRCTCGYLSKPAGLPKLRMLQRIHRHLHLTNRSYTQRELTHDNDP